MPEECPFYIYVFLSPLNKYVSSWIQSPHFYLFFSILSHMDLHFLLYLHIDYLSPTLGGLRLYS